MAIKEDEKKREPGEDEAAATDATDATALVARAPEDASSDLSPRDVDGLGGAAEHGDAELAGDANVAMPAQLGYKRFVYAAYFAGAIAIAFLSSKLISALWTKLLAWKPVVGEPRDEIVMPLSALIGALAAVYYWRRTRTRKLAEEVASELSKVTWPSRTEVTNSTAVVIVTTLVATVFFALMDRFWGFVTNLVYGT